MNRRYLLLLALILLSLSASAGQPTFVRVLIRPIVPEAPILLDAVIAMGAKNIRTYDAFTFAEVPLEGLRGLREAGVRAGWVVQDVDHWRELRMPGWTVVKDNPVLPANGLLDSYPNDIGLFVVQFNSPIREEWFPALRAADLDYIGYLPHNGVLVVAHEEDVERFAGRDYVEWVSLYHPAFRDQPPTFEEGEPRRFIVQFVDRPEAELDIAKLDSLSSNPVERIEYGRYVNIEATLHPMDAHALLSSPFVVGITEPGVPLFSGERESLSLSGLTPSPNTYRNWLFNRGVSDTVKYWIAVADSGFVGGSQGNLGPDIHQDFFSLKSDGTWAPNLNIQWKDYSGAHGSDVDGHGTAIAGIAMGNPPSTSETRDSELFWYGLGVAPKTGLIVQRIRSSTGLVGTVAQWLGDAKALGASVQTQSLNTYTSTANGAYITRDQQTDAAVRDTHLPLTVSVGNTYSPSGPHPYDTTSTLSPAVAKNVISVGGTESYRPYWSETCRQTAHGTDPAWLKARSWNNIAYLSRRNTADGRIKPDIVAPSTLITTALFESEETRTVGWCWHSSDGEYLLSSGTSFASPQAAAAIVLVQAKHGLAPPSAALAKAILVGTARSMKGGKDGQQNDATIKSIPDNSTGQGWGRLNLDEALLTSPHHYFKEQELSASRLTRTWNYAFSGAGQTRSNTVSVVDPSKPIIIVLAWTDEPANTGTSPVLVNDLTLKASTTNRLYYGNVLSNEWSQNALTSSYVLDDRNNVEVIRIPAGQISGSFTLEVTCDKWGSGHSNYYSQPFAIYMQNAK